MERFFKMTKEIIPGVFLALLLMLPVMPQAGAQEPPLGNETSGTPAVKTYDELVRAIREVRLETKTRVEQAKVREAWETGKLIEEHILHHKERAEYDTQLLVRLAKDLGSSRTEFSYMLQFAKDYKIFPTSEKLTWSDYRELLSLNDAGKRAEVSRKAARGHWDTQQIRGEVKRINQLARTGVEPTQILTAQPGIPHTYRVVPGVGERERVIDLGFSNYYLPPGKFSFKEGDIVAVNEKGTGTIFSKSSQSPDDLYTYEIKVLEVIDGDTIKAVVDLGFGFRTVQTLRLRGIDAPEIATADGMEAKKALEKMLGVSFPRKRESTSGSPTCPGQAFGDDNKAMPVLIKTVKSDKYDRYLADVFVADVYINQKLIDDGYAVMVEA